MPHPPQRLRVRASGIAAAALAASFATGCEQDDNPAPRAATFETVFAAFDRSGCAADSCHGGANLQADLDLDGLDTAYSQLVDVECANPEANAAGMLRVSSGGPTSSFLLTKLVMMSSDTALGLPMPPTGGSLTDDELALVRRWIEAGALAPTP